MSPYAEEPLRQADSTAALLSRYVPKAEKTTAQKRADLIEEFAKRLHKPFGFVCGKLAHLGYDKNGVKDPERELRDLYYIKSDCDQAAARGVPWGAAFYTAIKSN